MDNIKNSLNQPIATWNCGGRLIIVDKPMIMGIINVTPDSFFDGNAYKTTHDFLQQAGKMIADGAAIIDIGGQSTRPGSERISAASEMLRVIPVIEAIKLHYPEVLISIDTYHAEVATAAVLVGASMVNDISGGDMDQQMWSTVAALEVPYVLMHIRGTPENMQEMTDYADLIKEITDYFIIKIDACRKAGIKDIIIDPGFGFAKTTNQNFELLKNLSLINLSGLPILAGVSRKSMVYKTLGGTPALALNGTTVLNTIALMNGATILRVHDVKEAKEAVTLFEVYARNN
jgi:dihydropteroate synthase